MDSRTPVTGTTRTSQLLDGMKSGRLPEPLTDVSGVSRQRQAIDHYLSKGGHRVYGFTTYLGQRDDTDASDDYQDELLEGHLVGRTYEITAAEMRAMTISKLYQAQAGGSGISPAGYELALKAWEQNFPSRTGAWMDYYGAGDVIPGSWWISCLLSGDAPSDVLRPGDLIAMMSGTFVSTGFAAVALDEFIGFAGSALWALGRHCHPTHHALRSAGGVDHIFCKHCTHGRTPVDEQTTVVIRDGAPFTSAASYAVSTLSAAIDFRLRRPSANPWFDIDSETGLCHGHYSQSSFMDLRTSAALTTAADAVRFLAAGLKAVMAPPADAKPGQIEPPKIAETIIEELSIQPTARFAISEADAVEDICDRTLARADHLRKLVETGNQLIGLYTDAHGRHGHGIAAPELRQALRDLV